MLNGSQEAPGHGDAVPEEHQDTGCCTRGAPGCSSGSTPRSPLGLNSLLAIGILTERWRAEAKHLELRDVHVDTAGKPRSTVCRGCRAGSSGSVEIVTRLQIV